MNHIVDPRWFYFVNVVSNLEVLAICAAVVFLAVGGVILGVLYAESDFKGFPKETRFGKACVIIGVIMCLVAVFIPSKETLIEMEIARHVMYDSTETAVQMIQEATDYILEKTGEKDSK